MPWPASGPLRPSRSGGSGCPARCSRTAPPFLGTSGYGPVDNVSVLERFEDHAARWHAATGGSVVELHAYALPEGTDEADLRARMRSELDRLYPETTALAVVHEEWLVERDCVLVGLAVAVAVGGAHPDPRVVLAGDAVRRDLPVALMERAATTCWMAADRLLSQGGGCRATGVVGADGVAAGAAAAARAPRHPVLPLAVARRRSS